MAGRILIVEGTASHRILLRARLTSAFYEVLVAETGGEALAMIDDSRPDLVLAATELPDMCGSGFCTRLRALPDQADTPLVLLTEDDLVDERLALLAVGADDVIARAVEDILLLARLRSLLRRARAQDQMELRTDAKRALGLSEAPRSFQRPARVALVSLDPALGLDTIAARLRVGIGAQVELSAAGTLLQSHAISAEAVVLIDTGGEPGAGLALLSQLRTARAQHHAVLVYVTDKGRDEMAARALDLGADEVLHNGPEALELALRLPRLIGRSRRAKRHRAALRNGLRAAMVDPLTGLYNRRYALPEVARMAQQAARCGQPLALLVADLDHFKKVNDRWGHAVGDQVLVATAQRLTAGRRAQDLVARLGGEEFLIALPGADVDSAAAAGRLLCEEVARLSLPMPRLRAGRPSLFSPTISIGIALMDAGGEAVETALLRADGALYAAKHAGRNRAHVAPPAAFPHAFGALRGA